MADKFEVAKIELGAFVDTTPEALSASKIALAPWYEPNFDALSSSKIELGAWVIRQPGRRRQMHKVYAF